MFKGFFQKKKNTKKQGSPPLSPAIASAIGKLAGSSGIPTMPSTAQKAFELATDPNADARDFVSVIEADEALSARILKIANSVYFDRGKPTKTIEEAVTVIGIDELRCLLNATTLSELFPSANPARTQLWANDIATALIARVLAQRLLPAKAGVAFLGGLMHDIGKLLLLQRAPQEYRQVLEKVRHGATGFCVAEEDIFVCNHTEVGQAIAEKWRFSRELTEVIREHHRPWSSKAGPLELPLLIRAADTIAHAQGLGHGSGCTALQQSAMGELDTVFQTVGIASAERRETLQRAKQLFEFEYNLYSGKTA